MISYVMLLRSFVGVVADVILIVWIAVRLTGRLRIVLALLTTIPLPLRTGVAWILRAVVALSLIHIALPAVTLLLWGISWPLRVLTSRFAHLVATLIPAIGRRSVVARIRRRCITHRGVVEI